MSRWRSAGGPAGLAQTSLPVQFGWYLVVGGIAFLADLAIFVALLRVHATPSLAVAFAFLAGTWINYRLSVRLAFLSDKAVSPRTFGALIAVAGAGLCLTVLVMNLLIHSGVPPVPSRMAAAIAALFWNYFARRLLVFSPRMPVAIWRFSDEAISRLRRRLPGDARRRNSRDV